MVKREFYKVGARVATLANCWGSITEVDTGLTYGVTVKFDNGLRGTYTINGRQNAADMNRTLLTEEEATAVFDALSKFKPEIKPGTWCRFWDGNGPLFFSVSRYKCFEGGKYVALQGSMWSNCEPISDAAKSEFGLKD